MWANSCWRHEWKGGSGNTGGDIRGSKLVRSYKCKWEERLSRQNNSKNIELYHGKANWSVWQEYKVSCRDKDDKVVGPQVSKRNLKECTFWGGAGRGLPFLQIAMGEQWEKPKARSAVKPAVVQEQGAWARLMPRNWGQSGCERHGI